MNENQLIVKGSATDTLENLAASCAQLQAALSESGVVTPQVIEGVRLGLGGVIDGLEHLQSEVIN